NGCTTTASYTIDQPIPLSISTLSQKNVSCNSANDGEIQVVGKGGIPPYTYIWLSSGNTTDKESGLNAGNYSVTITDSNNETYTEKFTVTEPQVLTAVISSSNI